MAQAEHIERLTSIVAIDENGAIGCRNALPWSLKSDMAFFRRQTLGNSVIMGRKTYESIGGCLPGRTNIVLSHNDVLFQGTENCQLALSVSEALFRTARSKKPEAYVIGGALTYLQLEPFVSRYLVTIVRHKAVEADAFLGSEILANFATWDRSLIDQVPMSEGRDEFGFDIYEMIAPDSDARREKLHAEISAYSNRLTKPSVRQKTIGVKASHTNSQEAFAF